MKNTFHFAQTKSLNSMYGNSLCSQKCIYPATSLGLTSNLEIRVTKQDLGPTIHLLPLTISVESERT